MNEWNAMNEWLNNINQFLDWSPNWYLFYKLKATSFISYGSLLVTVWELSRYTICEGERESERERWWDKLIRNRNREIDTDFSANQFWKWKENAFCKKVTDTNWKIY